MITYNFQVYVDQPIHHCIFRTYRINHISDKKSKGSLSFCRNFRIERQWRIQDGIPPGCKPRTPPRRRCWMGEGGSMLEVIISFSDNVIGVRLLKIALTLN